MKLRPRIPIQIEGFEGQTVEVRLPGLFSGIELLVNGQPAPRGAARNQVILRRDDGREVTATWSRGAYGGLDLPRLSVDGKMIEYTEALRWYELAWAWGFPTALFIFAVVGFGEEMRALASGLGAVGDGLRVAVLLAAGIANTRVFQWPGKRIGKFVIATLVSILAVMICLGISIPFVRQQDNWQRFSSAEGRYSIEFPGTPEVTTQPVSIGGEMSISAHRAWVERGDEAYGVFYADYPEAVVASSTPEAQLDGARDGAVESLANASLVREDLVSLDGHPGRDFTIEATSDGETVALRARIYLVGNRLYEVAVGVPKEDAESADVTRFLDSFELQGTG